jgi:hypothetical protein
MKEKPKMTTTFKQLEDGTTQTTMGAVTNGEYFKRKADSKIVWIRGAYDHSSKKYECSKADDFNASMLIAGDKVVYIGFTY